MSQYSISLIIFIGLCLVISCSSSEKTAEQEKEDEVYVFDEVPIEETPTKESIKTKIEYNYFVQIGAFATKRNAELYAADCSEHISEELEIVYNDKSYLYMVRLKTNYNTQLEAERVRDRIRNNPKFLDAWIGKIQK